MSPKYLQWPLLSFRGYLEDTLLYSKSQSYPRLRDIRGFPVRVTATPLVGVLGRHGPAGQLGRDVSDLLKRVPALELRTWF